MTGQAAFSGVLIGGIRVAVGTDETEILKKAKEKMKRAGIATSALHFRLYKRSVDARRRDDIRLECTVLAEGFETLPPAERLLRADAKVLERADLTPVFGKEIMTARPLIVGMGPAGLFAALLLARNGYRPVIIDRGGSVEERAADVAKFRASGILDTESNIQFGAGGAGTFSDGKLVTRIKDARCAFVLETLHSFGAPDDILTRAKPHVGTDLLRGIVGRMLSEIARLGGKVVYHCRMEDFSELSDGTLSVQTSKGEYHASVLLLAIGNSARDTYLRLIRKQLPVEAKPISVGVRAEHLQREIDTALYGNFAGHPDLGHAEYALSDTGSDRGVYTFCMCPGGEVVAASSEEGRLCVNGMSTHARDGENANAAIAVSVGVADFEAVEGSTAVGAVEFQRKIERAAFLAGGGDYVAPVMTVGDLLDGRTGSAPGRIRPTYRGGMVRVADFENVFPRFVTEGLRRGLRSFGRKLPGYDAPDAVLTAAETRTSAPVRILRDPATFACVGHPSVYPVGEGAGYAGGITSASVDGVRAAMAVMARFAPPEKESEF